MQLFNWESSFQNSLRRISTLSFSDNTSGTLVFIRHLISMCPISKSIHSKNVSQECVATLYPIIKKRRLIKKSAFFACRRKSLERTLGNWHRETKKDSDERPEAIFHWKMNIVSSGHFRLVFPVLSIQ